MGDEECWVLLENCSCVDQSAQDRLADRIR
jgi:hypothetical protein